MKIRRSQLNSIISESIKRALSEEGIHIKEKNKGKFNATKERTGKSTEELTHSKNPITKKRAIFAQNAKKWNKVNESEFDFLNGDEFKWNNGYKSYVLVDDSCDAVIQNYTSENGYDAKQDAINDAKKKAEETRGGSFSVFGCVNNYYNEDTLVYCTSGNRDSWKF